MRWWTSDASGFFDSCFSSIAVDVHFEDRGVMDEAVYGRECHSFAGKDLSPFAKRLIGGDQHRPALVAGADQLEQNAGLRLVFGDVGEIVEDQKVVFVELGDGGFECEIAARDLKLLNQVGGSGEQDAPAVFDQG